MVATVTMKVHLNKLPTPVVDDERIARWIENRLNDARNHFIRNVGRRGAGRSKPGQYPARDEGRLQNSANAVMLSLREGSLRSDLEYAEYLTTGTTRMAPRKMLADALDDVIQARPATDQLAQAVKWETDVGK